MNNSVRFIYLKVINQAYTDLKNNSKDSEYKIAKRESAEWIFGKKEQKDFKSVCSLAEIGVEMAKNTAREKIFCPLLHTQIKDQNLSECYHCGSKKFIKKGFNRGNQRYKCKNCNRMFSCHQNRHRIAPEIKQEAIKFLNIKTGLRTVARMINVSPDTVWKWKKKYSNKTWDTDIHSNIV